MNNTISSIPAAEFLSALADGELGGAAIDTALIAFHQDGGAALSSWSTYHLIGDVLRAPSTAGHGADAKFLAGFRRRVLDEPPVSAAVANTVLAGAMPENFIYRNKLTSSEKLLETPQVRGRASNDESFRWKLAAGFASLAAVAAIAWNISGFSSPLIGSQIAQGLAPQQVLVASPQGPVVRDARLEELLAAHRQFGGMSALQAPSGFLQNATFDTSQGMRR